LINESICERRGPNKAVQIDNLQAVRFAVSLSLNFTAKQTAYKLRLSAALGHRKPITHLYTQQECVRHLFFCALWYL